MRNEELRNEELRCAAANYIAAETSRQWSEVSMSLLAVILEWSVVERWQANDF